MVTYENCERREVTTTEFTICERKDVNVLIHLSLALGLLDDYLTLISPRSRWSR